MLFSARVKAALAGLAVAGGAAAAIALGAAGPAVGQSSPPTTSEPVRVQVAANSPATLVANGADVNVSVTATCSGVDSGTVEVTLTESVKGDIAYGFGSATVDCTGTRQTADVPVVAQTSSDVGLPTPVPFQEFTNGPVIADTLIQACAVTVTSTGTITGPCADKEPIRVITIGSAGPSRLQTQTVHH